MKRFFTPAFFVFFSAYLHAQNLIAVEHNGSSTFYSTFDDAYNAAQNGDNIYLPGGSFTVSNPIAKSLHIYGTGYNSDSSTATGITVLNYISIDAGADNGSIEGIYFNNNNPYTISFINSVSNFTINRCYIKAVIYAGTATLNTLTVKNCYIGYYNGVSTNGSFITNSMFTNNVIMGSVNTGMGCVFSNNIFFYYLNDPANSSLCTFQNNIFQYGAGYTCSNSVFNNNINASPNVNMGNTGTGNVGETFDLTFVNPGPGPTYSYDVHNNYKLKSKSKGHNKGTDGTDMGIYGGTFPWRDGSMPGNPHIASKIISGATDANGNLNVNIKVAAQKN